MSEVATIETRLQTYNLTLAHNVVMVNVPAYSRNEDTVDPNENSGQQNVF